jgi:hypothetical protein
MAGVWYLSKCRACLISYHFACASDKWENVIITLWYQRWHCIMAEVWYYWIYHADFVLISSMIQWDYDIITWWYQRWQVFDIIRNVIADFMWFRLWYHEIMISLHHEIKIWMLWYHRIKSWDSDSSRLIPGDYAFMDISQLEVWY